MEVHHHPEVEKKGIKEYLLEGLMIFPAVTMGFIAENVRENRTNREKEKEYIISLVNNLQEDTTLLRYAISDNQHKITGLDSLLSLSYKNLSEPATRKLLYKYSTNYISFYSAFFSSDATLLQLKNSGGLQYIKRGHVADSIAKYDQVIRGIYAAEKPYSKAIDDAMDALSELIVFNVQGDTAYYKNGSYTNKTLPLLDANPQKIKLFFNKISYERGWTQNYINNLEERRPFAFRLIELLKKEYNL